MFFISPNAFPPGGPAPLFLPVEAKRRSCYRAPVAPEDGTGASPVKFFAENEQVYPARPVAPRGKPGIKPAYGTGVKPICLSCLAVAYLTGK